MSMESSDFGPREFKDGRTKQSFKDSTDVNKILKKAQKAGTLSHLQKHGAYYGDFADFDFFEAQNALARARNMFGELPSEVRGEFQNDPGKFFSYVNNPENSGRLAELLPALAEPGRQFPVVNRVAAVGGVSEPEASVADAPVSTEGSVESAVTGDSVGDSVA